MPVILMAIAALAVSGFIGVMRYIDKAPVLHSNGDKDPSPSKDDVPDRLRDTND